MKHLLLSAIRFYQRHLSPHKGFCCAYRQHTGRASCSALGYRAVRRCGVLNGLALLRRRMSLCGVAHRRFQAVRAPVYRPPAAQRGDCDLGCGVPGDCDMPTANRLPNLCDMASCCDAGSCDWRKRAKKQRGEEHSVYLPRHATR